ncbi:MAG: glycosyltransferase family 2 protein [Ilumatobacteraceae bacterium]
MTSSDAPSGTRAPFVRVVVVNYDGGPVTLRCLDALLATEHPVDRLEIVVVDNASIDGIAWKIREAYPRVRLIESDTNEGFARGCNLAMRDLDGVDFVALINNDAVVEPGWLAPLIDTCRTRGAGAACPKLLLNLWARVLLIESPVHGEVGGKKVGVRIVAARAGEADMMPTARFDERFWAPWELDQGVGEPHWTKRSIASVWWPITVCPEADGLEVELDVTSPEGATLDLGDQRMHVPAGRHTVRLDGHSPRRIINSAGGGLYTEWFGGDRGFLEPDVGQFDEPCEVFSWCGGAVLLSTDYLRDVGIFDPSYFLYYEDFDLSCRGRARGWTYWYDPRSIVLHEHALSSREGSDFFVFWVDRNRRLTLVKNAPLGVALRAVLGALIGALAQLGRHTLASLRRGRPPSKSVVTSRLRNLGRLLSALPTALRSRRSINTSRVVSRAEMQRWMVTK